MKTHPIALIFGLILSGCQIGLTSTGKVILEDTGEIDDEPASEPSVETGNEPSTEPSTEPGNEPSNEPDSDPTRDDDGDGYSENDGDCDDSDPNVNPSAHEIPSDDFDQNCDGTEICYQDTDGDGFATESVILSQDINCGNNAQEALAFARTTDCNDYDANINPDAIEIQDDGIDQDCDGVDSSSSGSQDLDGDGYDSTMDCNDFDASIYPGAAEIQNDGIDQDCDGIDSTSSGSGGCSSSEITDCNGNCAPTGWLGDGACDNGSYSYSGNQIYLDCASLNYDNGDCSTTVDLDGDGYDSTTDCNDTDASIYPGATEIQNDGIDQDCDGVDSTSGSTGCTSSEVTDCNGNCAPTGWLGDGICDSGNYTYGGNSIYLDCAALNYDDGDCSSSTTDVDGDGYDSTTDCDDNDASIYPGAPEIANDGIDQDCDGVDSTVPVDSDGDGYDNSNDCNDFDASIYPGATEIPNDGIDQDCDGSDLSCSSSTEVIDCDGNCAPAAWVGDGTCDDGTYSYVGNYINLDCSTHNYDDGDCGTSIPDADGDGHDSSTDCNDSDASIYPGATEIPNDGIDQDCDGSDLTSSCSSTEVTDCNGNCAPATWVGDGSCDDETYSYGGNYIDLNCSTHSYDDGDCVVDADGDGHDSSVDCDDSDPFVYPGANEIPNDGIDQDCDGSDMILGCSTGEITDCYGNCAPSNWLGDGTCDSGNYSWGGNSIYFDCVALNYDDGDCSTTTDSDGDGHDASTDCNDSDASIYPGATEIANDGIDQDCDGSDLTSSCFSTEVVDCDGNCAPASWVGDGYCDDGFYNLDCATHNYDGGDCIVDSDGDGYDSSTDCNDSDASIYPGATEIANDGIDQDCDGSDLTSSCTSSEVTDCNGNCAPSNWVGDGSCDDGAYSWLGNYIYLDCAAHNYDDGDCGGSSTTDSDGDGYDSTMDCDDSDSSIYPGAFEISDDGIDQDCDGSDLTCSVGEVGDCYGSCAPSSWLTDSVCDNGSYSWGGNSIYFDCAEHSFDNGSCP